MKSSMFILVTMMAASTSQAQVLPIHGPARAISQTVYCNSIPAEQYGASYDLQLTLNDEEGSETGMIDITHNGGMAQFVENIANNIAVKLVLNNNESESVYKNKNGVELSLNYPETTAAGFSGHANFTAFGESVSIALNCREAVMY